MFRDGLRIGGIDRRVSGTWSAGDLLSVNGATIIPGSAGGRFGTAVIDFGATFTDTASAVIIGQTWVTASSAIRAWMMADVTADSTAEEHESLAATCELEILSRIAGTGFTINAYSEAGFCKGQFTVHWEAN
jgi:hypothetical protein